MTGALWPHQVEALARLRASLGSGHRRPMLQAPTGAGKTKLASTVVNGALAKGKRLTFVVPALSLIDQTVEAFWADGIRDVGVIQSNHHLTDWGKPVQVASVQTLQRRGLPNSDIVVIDEAHRWFDLYGRWMADPAWAKVPFVGLSATPWTRGLGKHYDDLIIAATTSGLIEGGYLSPFRVFAPSHPDLSGVRTVAGDYHEGDLSGAMNQSPLVADVVETWRRLGGNEPTLVFAVDRAHAKHLQQQFAAAGISTGYIDAYTDAADREAVRRAFHDGTTKVVCNVGCLTTGVDWDVRCIVLARPTKSEMLFVQIVGRGLRTAAGKQHLTILDHSDTHLRLGFVTDIHHDRLDDGRERQAKKPGEAVRLPKECSNCSYLKPPKVACCPNCGFKAQVRSDVETVDGDLVELSERRRKPTMAEKQHWYSMLLHVQSVRGYKRGWAANAYRAKYSVWPNGLSEATAEPTPDVWGFVQHQLIRFAKGKRVQGKAELVSLAAEATGRAA